MQTKNFHVPLPEDLYSRLRKESERSQETATEIARKAIAAWLKEKESLHQSILEYAQKTAGSPDDLDETLELTSTEFLKQKKGRRR